MPFWASETYADEQTMRAFASPHDRHRWICDSPHRAEAAPADIARVERNLARIMRANAHRPAFVSMLRRAYHFETCNPAPGPGEAVVPEYLEVDVFHRESVAIEPMVHAITVRTDDDPEQALAYRSHVYHRAIRNASKPAK